MIVQFVVPGKVEPKGRPRFARRGKAVIAYTPAKTAGYESIVAFAAKLAMMGKEPSTRPLFVDVGVALEVPASWSKKKRAMALSGEILPTGRSDLDNYFKCLVDACNKICWNDDSQIVSLSAKKYYAEVPSATIMVREIEAEPA